MTCTGCGVFEADRGGLCKVCQATPAGRRPNEVLAHEAREWNACIDPCIGAAGAEAEAQGGRVIELGLNRPTGRVEHRQADPQGYGDLVVTGLLASATGDVSRDADALAVLEACHGKWRRALTAVTVAPDRARAVLTRRNLALVAEGLLSRDGAFVGCCRSTR